MFPPIYSTLRASSAVVAIVGDRIGAFGEIHQDESRPYVTHQIIAGLPENQLSDVPDTDLMQIQLNCYHATEAGVQTLVESVRDAIEPVAHVTGYPVVQRESATRLYVVAIQVDWWLNR